MIRVVCMDGPLQGHVYDRPTNETGDPPLIALDHGDGVYLAAPPEDELPVWCGWWVPVQEAA